MEQLPLVRAPDYLGQFAGTMAEFDRNSVGRLAAELEARRGALSSILSGSERIAGLGGVGAVDQMLGAYTGADAPFFNTDQARQLESLRMIGMQNDAMNVGGGGSGGGGGDGAGDLKAGWVLGSDGGQYRNVEEVMMANSYRRRQNLPEITIVQFAKGAPRLDMPTGGGDSGGDGEPIEHPDGTLEFPDGSRLRPDGTVE